MLSRVRMGDLRGELSTDKETSDCRDSVRMTNTGEAGGRRIKRLVPCDWG